MRTFQIVTLVALVLVAIACAPATPPPTATLATVPPMTPTVTPEPDVEIQIEIHIDPAPGTTVTDKITGCAEGSQYYAELQQYTEVAHITMSLDEGQWMHAGDEVGGSYSLTDIGFTVNGGMPVSPNLTEGSYCAIWIQLNNADVWFLRPLFMVEKTREANGETEFFVRKINTDRTIGSSKPKFKTK